MAKVSDEITTIEGGPNYVPNSLIVKAFDDRGCVLKWLESDGAGASDRKEKFIELDPSESDIPKLIDRTKVSSIDVNNPQ